MATPKSNEAILVSGMGVVVERETIMKKLHAWYSVKMAKVNGTFLYRKEDGEIVKGTIATNTMEHGCLWDDMVHLGEIVDCLGRETDGKITNLNYEEPEDVKKAFELIDSINNNPHRWN